MYSLLMIPVIMFLFGTYCKYNHSTFIGYRTYMSVKSEECFKEAQKIAGRVFTRSSYLLIICIFIFMLTKGPLLGFMIYEVLVWMGSMIYIEIQLRKQFDNKGKRK